MKGIEDNSLGAILRAVALVALALTAFVAVGCGEDEYTNDQRPPAVIAVTAFIGEDRLDYSPRDFGAGPAQLILINQTGTDQLVTISTDSFDRSVKIAQHQTAKLQLTLEPGYLTIEGDNTAGDPLEIEVGPERESAQHDLDQP